MFPVDRPPIGGGCVTATEGRIVELSKKPSGPVRDLGDVAILPGLVNAHTHLEFSGLASPIGTPGVSLPDWIRQVMASREETKEQTQEAISQGLAECIRFGTTSVGEISQPGWPAECFEGRPLDTTIFLECMGLSETRTKESLEAAQEHLAAAKGQHDWLAALSPHAPYTVGFDLLEALVDLSARHHVPLALHLAESPEELELMQTAGGPFAQLLKERGVWNQEAFRPGTKPLDYLKRLCRAHRALAIHGNFFESEEVAFVAAHSDRISVVYCPRTHAFFGHPPHPLPQLLAAGASVALGTDSRASNPDLDLLTEMRFAAREFPELSAETILRLGTLDGAVALGLSEESGSLTPGKWANLTIVPLPYVVSTDPHESLLATDAPVVATWYRGRQTFGEGDAI